MNYLANPTETKAVLQRFGFDIKKKYGQNFLIDENTVRKIVLKAGVTKEDTVLEIGPGIGTMTQILCEEAKKVVAVEIDSKLIPVLSETLSVFDNVTVINEDILKCDIREISKEYNEGRELKVVANLPYYITTPIIMGLLENYADIIESVTVMIQKEVADRINARPGTKDYGALTLATKYYASVSKVADVSASCFIPRPNVDSSVIRLDIYKERPVKVKDERLLFKLIRAAFAQRRKTMVNSISAVTDFSKEEIKEALCLTGKSENIRGEVLSLEEFASLSDILCSVSNDTVM